MSNFVTRRRFLRIAGVAFLAGSATSLLSACGDEEAVPTPLPTVLFQPAPSPAINPGGMLETAKLYLQAWHNQNYAEMYSLLTPRARLTISKEGFITRHRNIAEEATIVEVTPELEGNLPPPASAGSSLNPTVNLPFKVKYKTGRVGEITRQNKLKMGVDNGRWLVEWSPGVIFAELDTPGTLVRLISPYQGRGELLDRERKPLSGLSSRYAVFVVPGQIAREDEMLNELSRLLGMEREQIRSLYQKGQPDWRMPIRDLPATTTPDTIAALRQQRGIGIEESNVRSYPLGEAAGHVTGYLGKPNAEDLKRLAGRGVAEGDSIGKTGLEAWGEEFLSGSQGGRLIIMRQDTTEAALLAERPSAAPANLHTTIDAGLQQKAYDLLGGRRGSVIVMDVHTGALLVLVSSPGFNPNLFSLGISNEQLKALTDDPRRPFSNRATNGALPTGSVFKAITTATALEKLGITMQERFTCTGRWTALGEQLGKDCYNKTGHGNISLFEGLALSCDVVFYELGRRLDTLDPNLLPQMAKDFGLGSVTGLVGLPEISGQVPDPTWKTRKFGEGWVRGDAINLAIGQGFLLATPLQLALVYAAIANRGDLVTPRLVERAETASGEVRQAFNAPPRRRVPVSEANLGEIHRALVAVTTAQFGTARQFFTTSKVTVAGKTGTAESGVEAPHSWFACYAPAEQPRWAVVVSLENSGNTGQENSLPFARQMLDALPF